MPSIRADSVHVVGSQGIGRTGADSKRLMLFGMDRSSLHLEKSYRASATPRERLEETGGF